MDDTGPDSEGDYQHKRHRPTGEPVEGGGGTDRNLPPRQPKGAQRTPQVKVRKRDGDGYNGVKARP